MRTLFVFDAWIEMSRSCAQAMGPGDEVYLFSLTSRTAVNNRARELCIAAGCLAEDVNAAGEVNSSSDHIREKYLNFIAELPDKIRRRGKGLKEIFAIDARMSMWWLSLIAEKNIYKSDAFLRLVQLDAIIKAARSRKAEKIICGVESKRLRRALAVYGAKNGIEYGDAAITTEKNWKKRAKTIEKMLYLKHLLLLARLAAQFFVKTVKIKLRLAGLKRRSRDGSLMIATYYPSVDIEAAEKGVFSNKFWVNLQESLEKEGNNVTWLLMYVCNNSISFDRAMDYAVSFIRKGYSLVFLEEFNSVWKQTVALWRVIMTGFKYLRVETLVREAHEFDGYNFYELFRDDWYSSFVGATGYVETLRYMIFSSLFDKTSPAKCIYQCEMHSWEKALVAAGRAARKRPLLYAYQPATLSKMLLNAFNTPLETRDERAYSMPRPDKIICDGNLPFKYMVECGWPDKNLVVGEAIRYFYLRKHMEKDYAKKNVVLLALSTSVEEAGSILTLADEALKRLDGVEVWIRPHPFFDVTDGLRKAGLSEKAVPFSIKYGPIENLLPDVRIIIAGESGVAVEALAFGCELITISSSEWINMSPLRYERSSIVRNVFTAEELKAAIRKTFSRKYEPGVVREESSRILNDFFCLNHGSDVPSRILKELEIRG